jgi:hypothetical protein
MPLSPRRIVTRSPNQQEQQQEGLSSDDNQKTIKGASHSGMETMNAWEIQEPHQPKGNQKNSLTNNNNNSGPQSQAIHSIQKK